ncbi:MAG TPA: hypothetical protein DIT03_06445 [Candidatus Accumulibacter sp.]|nr:hypothetical protein [Accumulibacter sp.]HCV12932.1 hypothetical protein [Accumulibacter sp.]
MAFPVMTGVRLRRRWRIPVGLAVSLALAGNAFPHSLTDDDLAAGAPAAAALRAGPAHAISLPSPEPAGDPAEQEISPPWQQQAPLLLPANPTLYMDESAPRFATASRTPLTRAGRQVAPGTAARSAVLSIPGTAGNTLPGDEILTTLNDLQQTIAELIVETTEARQGPGGRVSFSLGGVEGFHYSARDGQTAIGHGDIALTVAEQGSERQQPVAGARAAVAIPASHDGSPSLKVIELLKEALAYPLVWVIVLLLLVAKLALLVASRRARKRRHGRRPQSSQQMAPQRVRKRIRIRVRQRQPIVGLQQRR